MPQSHSKLAERAALLKEMALFRDIPEEELAQLAGRFLEYSIGRGELLYEQGERAENFYIVLSGLLRSEQVGAQGKVAVSALEDGDPFGARTLLLDGAAESRVKALRNTQLLYLPRPDFVKLLANLPELEQRLRLVADGRRLKAYVDFDWLGKDELVHFVARKHFAYLWTRLARAIALAIAGLFIFYYAISATSGQFNWFLASAALIFGSVLWAIWEVLDWRNDYYILSDQRVVWLEQVLLRSSSRIEAPLESVQAVNTHTSLLGRLMGFGDVIIRTYTGTVLMPSVADPQNTKYLIEEYIRRARKNKRDAKHDSIRQAVRESLGIAPQNGTARATQAANLRLVDQTERFQLFKTRTIDGDKIIYHKHWFTLFSSLLLPVVFMVAALFVLNIFYGGLPTSGTGWLLILAAIAIPLGVMLYRFVDWQNDIYLVTPDNLMDSEKKPLGSLVTKSAPLANVLSLENHREGIIGLMLNFGVVRISVGDTSLDFENVHNPAQVQQDIFARMEALKYKLEQKKGDDERARMTEWLRVYEEERGRRPQPPAGSAQEQG